MIREAIEQLINSQALTMEDASTVMREIMEGESTPAQLAAFLIALRMKGETAQEMAGMAAVMREKALRVEVDGLVVDTAGTGGDGKGTFNISTAAAFVAAGAGVKVAKHGNRAASGSCGSADVLEEMGVAIELGPEQVRRCIEEVGIGFMYAPAFHPAMKYAVPVRRELGIRTVFNLLGPLTNPAGAGGQLVGTPDVEVAEKMAQVLHLLGSQHSMVVHGDDGLDELTLGSDTQVWEVRNNDIQSYRISPSELGLPAASLQDIQGGDKADKRPPPPGGLQRPRRPCRRCCAPECCGGAGGGECGPRPGRGHRHGSHGYQERFSFQVRRQSDRAEPAACKRSCTKYMRPLHGDVDANHP